MAAPACRLGMRGALQPVLRRPAMRSGRRVDASVQPPLPLRHTSNSSGGGGGSSYHALSDVRSWFDVKLAGSLSFNGEGWSGMAPGVYGGHLLTHAAASATETMPDPALVLHSVHAYFLEAAKKPGDGILLPLRYEVDCVRDGRSFSIRRVHAFKRGGEHGQEAVGPPLFTAMLSFQRPEAGLEHQPTVDYTDHPDPETLEGYSWNREDHDFRMYMACPLPRVADVKPPSLPCHFVPKCYEHPDILATALCCLFA